MTRGLVEVIILTTGFWGSVNESLMKNTILISRFIPLCFEEVNRSKEMIPHLTTHSFICGVQKK